MSPQPQENDHRSVLSWESVLDATDTDSSQHPPTSPEPPAPAPSAAPGQGLDAPTGADIELNIAPLSLDPLSLDPPPPIPESPTPTLDASAASAAVIGDLHLELAPLELNDPVPTTAAVPAPRVDPLPPIEPVVIDPMPVDASPVDPVPSGSVEDASPVFEMPDLKIAPLDVAQGPISGEIAAVLAADDQHAAPTPAAVAPTPAPEPTPVAAPAPAPDSASTASPAPTPVAVPAPAVASAAQPTATPASSIAVHAPSHVEPPSAEAPVAAQPAAHVSPVAAPAATVPASAVPASPAVVTEPAIAAGLPNDPVAVDATPTTVIAEVIDGQIAPPAMPGDDAGARPITDVSVVSIPNLQPNQLNQAVAPAVARVAQKEPAPAVATVGRKDRKHDKKLKKHQQKQALKAAKAKSKQQRSGGGVALFFTLLVLVGLIAGAIIFGKPYLFPEAWDDASRPYGEAVEAARGTEFDNALVVQRRATDAFAVSMAEHVIGPWENDVPTWRSLGLLGGVVDAPGLAQLIPDWTQAYYSPTTGEVIANDAAPATIVDAAITEALAAAALDQEIGWSSSINDALLDDAAITRAAVTASSRATADATAFGVADVAAREIGVSTFLPPVLEYRVNAADTYAEFGPDNAVGFDAVVAASQLSMSTEPEIAEGETLVQAQQPTDRTFWYLVFASYADAATAYAASNDLVQASLATTDAAGTQCTYGTFSGTDVTQTARVADVLQQWVANVPAEMTASFTTLPNGSMQLRSCDPGEGVEMGARFGIGREIARLRAVELAAVTDLAPVGQTTPDPAAVITEVRTSAIGLALLDLGFEVTPEQTAVEARAVVAAATLNTVTGG